MKTLNKLWAWLAILILLSPLGLILPGYFKSRPPLGEESVNPVWRAPWPNYAFQAWGKTGLLRASLAYLISAAIGIAVVVALSLLIGKFLLKNGKK